MKKATIFTLITALVCMGQTPQIFAQEPGDTQALPVLITEIQTGGINDATQEFVEIYNPNNTELDVTGWQLQYRAASGLAGQAWPGSSTKATIACPASDAPGCTVTMPAHGRLVFVRTISNIVGALPMAGGFSDSGGQIRLIKPANPDMTLAVQDFIGYGNAADAEGGHPAIPPEAGTSIKRKMTENNIVIDTNNNLADFLADCGNPSPGLQDSIFLPLITGCLEPTPEEPQLPPTNDPGTTPPTAEEPGEETPEETPEAGGQPAYLPILITELLPDPASPQQDSNDEFIELYNPNDTAVTLLNYRLQTGSEYRYTYTLGDTPLGPHMYMTIPSAVSKLSLVNSGSGVRLIDPNGAIISEVSYDSSKEGQSWMYDSSGWRWTLSPTPGAANNFTTTPPKAIAATTPTKKKGATTTKKAAVKTTVPKAPKTTTTSKKTTEAPKTTSPVQQPAVAQAPQYWLLVPIGALAASYAAYEYRQDIGRAARRSWARVTGKGKKPQPEAGEE